MTDKTHKKIHLKAGNSGLKNIPKAKKIKRLISKYTRRKKRELDL